jgi:hypothetical protein
MKTHRFSNYHSLLNLALSAASSRHEKLLKEIAEFKKNSPQLNERDRLLRLHEFGIQLEQSRIVVVLLSCSFIEARINFYISLKCKPEQFEILERASLLDKWTAVPSLFAPEY